ncbi:MAG: DUF6029 family protein [Chitinophagales bacterium]|nr:DUF6029 family protein [Chitinophagales bacterium]MDW8419946.1 DUF6029 family protein [Chitinophagales bacterium]
MKFCYAQNGYFGGSFQSNANFFIRDEKIGAANLPHYDNLKVGADAWLNLNYTNDRFGLETGVRLDLFYNSILRVPTTPYNGVGIGNFFIKKKFNDLTITGGYIYDQIGTGIIFRTYEERMLGIDNALLGARSEYNIQDKVRLKAFAGVQKLKFGVTLPVLVGANAEGSFTVKDKAQIYPGIGVLNRSLDQETMNRVVSTLESYDTAGRFVPKYNTYAFTAYNTLTIGPVTWYVEGAYKTREAIKKDQIRDAVDSLINSDGSCIYSTLNYSTRGFGFTLQFKRTDNFYLHNSPNPTEALFDGVIAFLPPISRQNSLRLPARYFAQSLENRELAFGLEATYSPVKKVTLTMQGAYIRDFLNKKYNPTDTTFFGEAFLLARILPVKSVEVEFGMHYARYNAFLYRKEGHHEVDAYSPFAEVVYKINKKHSIRAEFQYQHVIKDWGQWLFGLLEYSFAPHLTIAVSDMWNFDPNPEFNPYPNHYYSVYAGYTRGPHKFNISYVKQVEGIVCTGGVCRLEPAFSGVKVGINTTF